MTTPHPPPGRPPDGQSRIRHVRVPDGTWDRAIATATANGTNVAAVIRQLLDRYAKGDITL